jgi:hypothetical protein
VRRRLVHRRLVRRRLVRRRLVRRRLVRRRLVRRRLVFPKRGPAASISSNLLRTSFNCALCAASVVGEIDLTP